MAWFEFIWIEGDGGNIDYIAQHGVTPDDFEHAFCNAWGEGTSHTSGRPIRFGDALDGRPLVVVFEWIEPDIVVYPVTAYEIGE